LVSGAFHQVAPSDLLPELQGRLPIRVKFHPLVAADFEAILTRTRHGLVEQCVALLATEGLAVAFTACGVAEVAASAAELNRGAQDIGARRLHAVISQVTDEISFMAHKLAEEQAAGDDGGPITIDAAYVKKHLSMAETQVDLSRYVL